MEFSYKPISIRQLIDTSTKHNFIRFATNNVDGSSDLCTILNNFDNHYQNYDNNIRSQRFYTLYNTNSNNSNNLNNLKNLDDTKYLDVNDYCTEIKKDDNNLDRKTISIDDTCSICLNNLMLSSDNQTEVCQISCKHLFHKNCISEWLLKKKNCPKCRKKCLKYNNTTKYQF